MKKIIYIFIFLLPIILFSCSGSNNEAELKSQLEIAEQNFDNFNNKLYVLLDQYNVTAADTKEILNKIQESFTLPEDKNESETDNTESEAE